MPTAAEMLANPQPYATGVPWPSDWPGVLLDSWSLEPAPHTLVSEMETGAPRVRVVSRARNDRVNASLIFTRHQFATFRALFESTAPGHGAYGAGWWWIPIFIGRLNPDGSFPEAGLPECEGEGVTRESCRFIGQWSASVFGEKGKYIRVDFKLEIRD